MFESISGRMPPIVKGFILANVGVFLLQLFTGGSRSWLTELFALGGESVQPRYWYQMASYMWLHGSVVHLVLNMIGLYYCGCGVVERAGKKQFIRLYLFSGLCGAWVWLIFTYWVMPGFMMGAGMVGASAAVLGLLVAFAMIDPDQEFFIMFIPIPIRARWVVIGYFLYSVVSIFWGGPSVVAHAGHLGGLVGGYLYARCVGLQRGGLLGVNVTEWVQERLPKQASTPASREAGKSLYSSGAADFVSKEVDPILDKIAQHGFQSLTVKEKAILEEARKKLK